MTRVPSVAQTIEKLLLLDSSLKLTSLRKDILTIFIEAKKPASAYDVLKILKNQRDGAKPPTVYRVIEYFINKNIIHRIDAENKYVFCSQLELIKLDFHGIIFICKKCLAVKEVIDEHFIHSLMSLSEKHQFKIEDSPVEIKGLCQQCMSYCPTPNSSTRERR